MALSLEEIAARQWRDYRARTPGTYFGESHSALDLDQAYYVQQAVARLRVGSGDEIIGYKVGCTGDHVIAQFGMAGPIRGCLYRSEVRQSGETLDLCDFAKLAIEGEMALRIGPDGEPLAAFPIIELHNFIFRGKRKTLAELVANNGLQAGIIMPPHEWLSSKTYLTGDAELTVHVNGRLLGSASLWPMSGGLQASLEWLRRHLTSHDLALMHGQLVLAGTSLGLYPVGPGDHVVVGINDTLIAECRIGRPDNLPKRRGLSGMN